MKAAQLCGVISKFSHKEKSFAWGQCWVDYFLTLDHLGQCLPHALPPKTSEHLWWVRSRIPSITKKNKVLQKATLGGLTFNMTFN